MNFDLNEEQKILKTLAHDFLAKECPKELVRKLDESNEGYSPELWNKMAELGWLGVAFPEEYGGNDGTFLDLVILLEEMGYNIVPGPFFSTVVLGGLPILLAGNEKQKKEILPQIANGKKIFTFALTESSANYRAAPKVSASFKSGNYGISGTKLFVPDANVSDYIICVAKTGQSAKPEDNVTLFIVDAKSPGIKCSPLKTLARDKQNEVIFDDVSVPVENILGKPEQGWAVVKDILEMAAVAKSAEMFGGSRAVLDLCVQYTKDRVQFGRPIGSFQSIQNYIANMWVDIYGSSFLVHKAAWKITNGLPASVEAAIAKAWVSRAYRRVTALGHHILGAISFTMDHDMHLYYRRAKASELAFGDAEFQRAIIAEEINI